MAADDTCPICDEAITNPICLDCLERELGHWLLTIGKQPMMLRELYRGFPEAGTRCVICGEESSVCAHCYCEEALNLIKQTAPELEEDFLSHFNYELEVPFN